MSARRPRINDEYLEKFATTLVLFSRGIKTKISPSAIQTLGSSLGLSKRRCNLLYNLYSKHVDRLALDRYLAELRSPKKSNNLSPAQLADRISMEAPHWELRTINMRHDQGDYYAVTLQHRLTRTTWNMWYSLQGTPMNNYPPHWPD